MRTPKLHLRKFFTAPIIAAPLVLGLGGVALASNPTATSPALPSDQIVLNGSCIPATQVLAAAEKASSLYVPGGPPAGVIVNGNWIPAAMVTSSTGYMGGGLCAGLVVPTDQIIMRGSPTVAQVMAAAKQAMSLYVSGGPPAGVIVNGNWIPAGIATSTGGYSTTTGR